MSLTAGPVDGEARLPGGDVIDRAARLLAAAGERGASSPIRVDEVTAGLLGDRFDVRNERGTLALLGEHVALDAGRRLLGRPTLCLGRERELGLLEALFAHAVEDSSANAALIVGEPGVGKSRVRHELLRRLRERGERFEVWVGCGDPMSAGSAFAVLARAVRYAAGILDGDPIELRRERIRRRVATLPDVDRAAAFLGELSGAPLPDGASAQLRAARADPVLMGDQIRRAAEDLMRAACGRGTLILVLEDLQWGDLPTVTFVDAALRNLADLPLLVLALARPEVEELFPRLWDGRATQVVRLPPLPRRAAERLVRHGLGEAAPAELVGALVERAGGNAFYLEELTRAVVSGEDGASRPGHHASPPADPRLELPDTVLAMAQARLEGIDPELRRVLRAASVFGRTFSPGGVEALLGGGSIGPRLGVLLTGELLVRHGDAAPDYGFRHALVREAAYGMLTEEDRVLGHRLAGAWLEGTGKGDAMALAEHFERGGEPARAATFYRRAAEEALAGNDLAAALHRAARGAACGAGSEDLGALRLVEAEAHLWRGELALSEARGDEAAALLGTGSSSWFRAITQTVFAACKQGAVDRIAPHAEAAVAASPAAGAESARVLCLSACAGDLTFAGRLEAGDALFAHLAEVVGRGRSVDAQALGMVLHSRALRGRAAGDLGAAVGNFERAVAALDQAGDRRSGCNARSNLGFVYVELGGFAEGESALRAAHAEAERLGLFELAATALQNLGYALFHEGRLPEARAFEERSIATLAPLGSARLTGSARTYLARIHLGAGDAVAAEREARAAAHLLGTAPGLRAVALAVAARALSQQGRVVEALAAAEEAFALLVATGGSLEEGESLVRLVHAEALAAAGRASEARAALGVRPAAAPGARRVHQRSGVAGALPLAGARQRGHRGRGHRALRGCPTGVTGAPHVHGLTVVSRSHRSDRGPRRPWCRRRRPVPSAPRMAAVGKSLLLAVAAVSVLACAQIIGLSAYDGGSGGGAVGGSACASAASSVTAASSSSATTTSRSSVTATSTAASSAASSASGELRRAPPPAARAGRRAAASRARRARRAWTRAPAPAPPTTPRAPTTPPAPASSRASARAATARA